MAYVPHYRVTALGDLPGGEQFSFGFALAKQANVFVSEPLVAEPNAEVWDDIRDDVQAFFVGMGVSNKATLRKVKVAPIGANGLYTGAPVERLVEGSSGQAGTANGPHYPNQIAMTCTLHTEGDIARVKGRFYVPVPCVALDSSNRISAADRDAYRGVLDTFVTNVNNQPGLDVLDLRVVVASQGRFNANGTQRVPPGNHPVTAVSVGRVLDTVRRRRNQMAEDRGTPASVS